MIKTMQGDSYELSFDIRDESNNPITDESATNVEIYIGTLRKDMSSGVSFDSDTNCWKFPLSQLETIQLCAKSQTAQVRVKFNSGDVIGVTDIPVSIEKSVSREVL